MNKIGLFCFFKNDKTSAKNDVGRVVTLKNFNDKIPTDAWFCFSIRELNGIVRVRHKGAYADRKIIHVVAFKANQILVHKQVALLPVFSAVKNPVGIVVPLVGHVVKTQFEAFSAPSS